MDGTAFSPEQEFAALSQDERDALIAQFQQTAAGGRGSLEVRPRAIRLPLLLGFLGIVMAWAALASPSLSSIVPGLAGLALAASSAWAMFGPRKPCFTLTEEGVRVQNALLPWPGIDDYSVTEHGRLGFPTHTSVVYEHADGFTPPELGLHPLLGASNRNSNTGEYATRLTLYTGAKGMNGDQLAERIAEYLDAAHARAKLARLQAS
ncbi:MAG: hypothetical protein LBI48_02580 [Burkholderiaceae bacterium]|nr:hypothetical protein [Burkholderiaceae bacterium]